MIFLFIINIFVWENKYCTRYKKSLCIYKQILFNAMGHNFQSNIKLKS